MKIFIGYDEREDVAYEVCKQSILNHTKTLLDIEPIKIEHMRASGIYTRSKDVLSSTDFAFTRFLTPKLCRYEGWALFVDCDTMFRDDVMRLFAMADEQFAVQVVQQVHIPEERVKMDGKIQFAYPRKNWSSLILWNCGHKKNRILTPELVSTESGQFLHRFQWLEDNEIGALPLGWNWISGYGPEWVDPKMVHFSLGIPEMIGYENYPYAEEWREVRDSLAVNAA